MTKQEAISKIRAIRDSDSAPATEDGLVQSLMDAGFHDDSDIDVVRSAYLNIIGTLEVRPSLAARAALNTLSGWVKRTY